MDQVALRLLPTPEVGSAVFGGRPVVEFLGGPAHQSKRRYAAAGVDEEHVQRRATWSDERERVREAFAGDPDEYHADRYTVARSRRRGELLGVRFEQLLPADGAGASVLEVAAGTGFFTIPLLRCNYRVTATDVNEGMLNALRKTVWDAGYESQCTVQHADAFELPYGSNSFAGVVCMKFLPRLTRRSDQRAALGEMSRVLRPGGWLLFNFRNQYSLCNLYRRRRGMTASGLESTLAEFGLRVERRAKLLLLDRKTHAHLPLWGCRVFDYLDRALPYLPGVSSLDDLALARRVHGDGAQAYGRVRGQPWQGR